LLGYLLGSGRFQMRRSSPQFFQIRVANGVALRGDGSAEEDLLRLLKAGCGPLQP
jgi:hypothetical protein